MAETDRPAYSFGSEPPPEVAAFLRNKVQRPSFSFRDVEPEEHAVAFTVAKAMQADVLDTIRAEVQRAIDEGRTLEQFRRGLRPRLQALGWWGRREMVDPDTGEVREVQLGSPRRLKTIYRANLRSARAAGQWDRIQRSRRALPFLLYLLGPSERHRPTHQAQAGRVLPADSPFWDWWFPPNGWGCKCHVRQISAREAERRGISPDPAPEMVTVTNPRTGRRRELPRGLDPSWAGNPGRQRATRAARFLEEKLIEADPAIARSVIADVLSSWRVRRFLEGAPRAHSRAEADRQFGWIPVAQLPGDLASQLGIERMVVHLSGWTQHKQGASHPDVQPEDYAIVQQALEHGAVYRERDGSLSAIVSQSDRWWRVVLKRTNAGDQAFVKTFHRIDEGRAKSYPSADRSLVRVASGGA